MSVHAFSMSFGRTSAPRRATRVGVGDIFCGEGEHLTWDGCVKDDPLQSVSGSCSDSGSVAFNTDACRWQRFRDAMANITGAPGYPCHPDLPTKDNPAGWAEDRDAFCAGAAPPSPFPNNYGDMSRAFYKDLNYWIGGVDWDQPKYWRKQYGSGDPYAPYGQMTAEPPAGSEGTPGSGGGSGGSSGTTTPAGEGSSSTSGGGAQAAAGETEEKSNVGLYVGLGIAAVAVVGGILYATKKSRASNPVPSYSTNDPRGWAGDPRRGAAMGRGSRHTPNYAGKLYIRNIRLDTGGYDKNGTYFGHGEPLYWIASENGAVDYMVRAANRDDAKQKARSLYPRATFAR